MSNSPGFKSFLKDVIFIMKENIIELKGKRTSADEKEKEYIDARLLSYYEIISSIKNQLKEYNISESEIGIDKMNDIL